MAQETAKKTAPKKPTDRKVKGEEAPAVMRPEDIPGWDLLKPFSDIPVWDQTPLIQLLQDAFDDSSIDMSKEEFANLTPEQRLALQEEGEVRSFDVNVIGQLALRLRDFAIDEDEYTKFCSGPKALERSMTLAMAWVGQMGESIGSENS